MPRPRLLSLGAVLGAFLAAPALAAAKPIITMSGSTSIAPLATALAKAYAGPHNTGFRISQGGSDIGITDVSRGRVTIGNSSRDFISGDPGGIVFNKIARDAVCVVTNPRNRLGSLSQGAIQSIFSGRVRNWSKVPGHRVSGPISLVVRTPASGTQDAFQNIFLGQGLKVAGSAQQKASNGLVQQAVRSNPRAIGYVSLDFAAGLAKARYKGVACSLQNAKSGQYGGTRNFWMVTRGRAAGAAKSFISWIRRSSTARRITQTHWVPLG